MARGQSPFQGRYNVPQVDFSPIAQSGRDIGAALASIGGNLGSAIVKRKELKGKLSTYEKMLKGIEAEIETFPGYDQNERDNIVKGLGQITKEVRDNPDMNLVQKVAAFETAMPLVKNMMDRNYRRWVAEMENRPPPSIAHHIQKRPPVQPVAPQVRGDPSKVPSEEEDTGVRTHSIFDAMAKDRGAPLPVELDASAQLKLNAKNDEAEKERARQAVSDMEAAMSRGAVGGLTSNDKTLYETLKNKANATTPDMAKYEANRFVGSLPKSAGATVTVSTDKTGNASWSATATYKGKETDINPVTFSTPQGTENVPGLFKIEGHTGFFTTKDGKFKQVSDSSNSAVAIDSHRLALEAVLDERERMFPLVSNLEDDTDLTFEEFKQIYESNSKDTKDGIWKLILRDDNKKDKTIEIDTNTQRYREAEEKYKEYREESENLQKLTNLLGRTDRTEIPFTPNAIQESLDIEGGSAPPDSFDIEEARNLINTGNF